MPGFLTKCVENSLDVTRVVMEYLTKKLPNVVVAMPK